MSQYTRTTWQDSPSTATPLTAANLNNIEAGIDAIAKGALTLTAGTQETGRCGVVFNNALTTHDCGVTVNFKMTMTRVPTSITFTASLSSNNTGPSADDIDVNGFRFLTVPASSGQGFWSGSYTTVGNCLLAVDAQAQTFDHHCDVCRHVTLDAPLSDLTITAGAAGSAPWVPGHATLSYRCRHCGAVEAFNTALDAAAERVETLMANPRSTYRVTYGEQARLVRALIRALGYPLVDDMQEVR